MLKYLIAAAAMMTAVYSSADASGGSHTKGQLDMRSVELIAQMTYCEARGEGQVGMRAVAHVILNRVDAGRWGDTPEDVMSARYQFSCWPLLDDMRYRGEAWEIAQQEALAAVTGYSSDPSRGATHYHATYVSPRWSRILPRITRIGRHIFYV
jgi:spore germination cell wall hydrolase CwlJ-like protein